MDDLRIVRELGDETPMAAWADVAPARARLAAEITAVTFSGLEHPGSHSVAGVNAVDTARPAAARPVRSRRLTPRFLWLQAAAGAAAAVAIGAALVYGAGGASTGKSPSAGGESTAAIAPPLNLTAVAVLDKAAEQALTVPDIIPRNDQFWYTKAVSRYDTSEYWYSIDGTRDGLRRISGAKAESVSPDSSGIRTLPGGRVYPDPSARREAYDLNGDFPIQGCPKGGRYPSIHDGKIVSYVPCAPDPVYLADRPTDAAGMLAYLRQRSKTSEFPLIKEAEDIVDEYLRPRSRAALFQALAQIDDAQVVESVKDGAGRPGVGIRWGGEIDLMMVFDQKTFGYLGTDTSAVMAVGIVDQVGQLP